MMRAADEVEHWLWDALIVDSEQRSVGRLVCLDLAATDPCIAQYARDLSKSELQRADRFHFAADRRRFIVGRARLRRILGDLVDVVPSQVPLRYGSFGKPELDGPAGVEWGFNLSNSQDLAVIAVCKRRRVGVDIESIRRLDEENSLAEDNFSPAEYAAYTAHEPAERNAAFFRCWTRKEAFIKADGGGLSHPLKTFDVSVRDSDPPRVLRVENRHGADCGWGLGAFSPAPGYQAAVAVELTTPGLEIRLISVPRAV